MKDEREKFNLSHFQPAHVDEKTGNPVSPERLQSDYGLAAEIDAAYELIARDPTPADFYRAASFLIFHARHLSPRQHSEIAGWLSEPYSRMKGRQRNFDLDEEVQEYAWASKSSLFAPGLKGRNDFIIEMAIKYKIKDEIVRRKLKIEEDAVKLRSQNSL